MDSQNLSSILSKTTNGSHFSEFLHSCINEKCGYPGPTYQQFLNIGWTEDEYNYVHGIMNSFFANPAILHLDEAKMPQEFFLIPETLQHQILSCLRIRQQSLTNALMTEYSQKNKSTLLDFDWRLKMVMGTSKVASLREPLLQLDLRVKENSTERILGIEMNKDELDSFIKVLDSVK